MDSADELFFHNFLCDFDDSSSDDEEILAAVLVHHHLNSQRRLFRGSIPGHLPALNRNRESGHFLLWKDYFDTTNPLFKHQKSRHRFRMSRHLIDEYVRMSEYTCLESMYKFCKAVIDVFGLEYFREPTAEDTTRLLAMNARRASQGCLAT